jgi:hypothetical protein
VSTLDKDSSVTLRGMLALPPKRFRLFLIASIEATWVPAEGGNGRPLRRGERAIAFEVGPARRSKILERAGCSRKTWNNAVREWTARRMAHRCTTGTRGVVCLFIAPLNGAAAICPRCSVPLGGQVDPVGGTTWSRSGDSEAAVSKRTTSDDATEAVKVHLQGEGEGGEPPAQKTPLQEVLEEQEALARFRAHFPTVKKEAS